MNQSLTYWPGEDEVRLLPGQLIVQPNAVRGRACKSTSQISKQTDVIHHQYPISSAALTDPCLECFSRVPLLPPPRLPNDAQRSGPIQLLP